MNLKPRPTLLFPTLPKEVLDSLPESVRSYIRDLEEISQKQEGQEVFARQQIQVQQQLQLKQQVQIRQLEAQVHELFTHLPKNNLNSR